MASNLCNTTHAVAFVHKYKVDCEKVISEYKLDVPVENILGLAASESEYGKGRIAGELNNYFSMRAPAPFQTGQESAQGDPRVIVAKFGSFYQGAQSFSRRFGDAVRGKKDPREFAQALMAKGYNTGNAKTGGRDGFVNYLIGIINAVKGRLSCSPG